MSRLRRAIHGVASSYVQLAATAFYSLASVPVALHYLDTQRFGLWVVVGTLMGYLNLIDAGMTGSSLRLLVDHKDERQGGNYGSFIKTSCLVSTLQGGIILIIGLALAGTFARLLAISQPLQPEFIRLVNWQCGVVALTFTTRILGQLLYAHQRRDLNNYIGVGGLMINFAAQWVFFHFNFGVLSLALGSLFSTVLVMVFQTGACAALNLFPRTGGWGRVSGRHFVEIFNLGKDLLLISVGSQLITTSQVIIITRMLGPAEAAVWGIGLRVFNLLNQVIWRIADMSWAGFAEMLARGELARLRDRYRSLTILSISFAGWAAVSFALCNSLFVSLWTHGKIQWPVANDSLLALWMIVSAAIHCHTGMVITTKQIGFMRYVYLLEGAIFAGLSFLAIRWGGLAAIIGCSVLCDFLLTGNYGIWRISRFLGLSFREVALDWLRPMFKVLLVYLPVAALTWWLLAPASSLMRLFLHALLAGSIGLYLLLRFGIPVSFQNEILGRVPAKTVPFLKRLFHQPVG